MSDNFSNHESFADLFKDDTLSSKQLAPGQKIKATIVDISQDTVFLDVGGKSEGYLDRKELEDEEGNVSVNPGESLDVYFLSSARNEMLFTTRIGGGQTSRSHLEEAFQSNIPVEGFVKKEIKGGFEVTVAGNIRTFCPYSQMDLARIRDPDEYLDKHLLFKITQFSEGGRNIVLSRRVILEEEREEKRAELENSLQEGMTVKGTVTAIKDFGAFVDIDGIEGLIPVSEISWSRTENIKELLAEGQDVEVVILKLDWDKDRFSFSLKQALPDPWLDVANKFPVGSFHSGTVNRLAKFGAFVNLAEGIDGLIHISRLGGGRRINHPKEAVEEGQQVDVKIEDVDPENKRMSLSLVAEPAADEDQADSLGKSEVRQYMQEQKKDEKKQPLGTFGDLLRSKLKEKNRK